MTRFYSLLLAACACTSVALADDPVVAPAEPSLVAADEPAATGETCSNFSFGVNYAQQMLDAEGNFRAWEFYDYGSSRMGPDPMERMLREYEPYFAACLDEEGANLERLDFVVLFNGNGKIRRVTKAALPLDEQVASACMLRLMRRNLSWLTTTNRVDFRFAQTSCPDE